MVINLLRKHTCDITEGKLEVGVGNKRIQKKAEFVVIVILS